MENCFEFVVDADAPMPTKEEAIALERALLRWAFSEDEKEVAPDVMMQPTEEVESWLR